MRYRGYTSEAIILSRKNYGEADRILILYTKDFGLLKILAKGIRKPKSRKRGHLEIFSRIKFSASRTNSFEIMTEAQVIDSYDDVRKDLKKVTVAYFLCESLIRLTQEGEKNSTVYSNSVDFMEKLKTAAELRNFRKEFLSGLLIELGFWSASHKMEDPDKLLEEISERRVNSIRVGKALLS